MDDPHYTPQVAKFSASSVASATGLTVKKGLWNLARYTTVEDSSGHAGAFDANGLIGSLLRGDTQRRDHRPLDMLHPRVMRLSIRP
jgi:hypothetical protein